MSGPDSRAHVIAAAGLDGCEPNLETRNGPAKVRSPLTAIPVCAVGGWDRLSKGARLRQIKQARGPHLSNARRKSSGKGRPGGVRFWAKRRSRYGGARPLRYPGIFQANQLI